MSAYSLSQTLLGRRVGTKLKHEKPSEVVIVEVGAGKKEDHIVFGLVGMRARHDEPGVVLLAFEVEIQEGGIYGVVPTLAVGATGDDVPYVGGHERGAQLGQFA
jgi:hypothetical protein